jgi:two-component system CheB/CheR fusion protein
VLDAELMVQVWNEQAAETWGLRSDEVLGESFFTLDIGLPVKDLRTMLRAVLRGKPADEVIVDAVNRRGRKIRCRVAVTTLPPGGKGGVVLLLEEVKNSKSNSSSPSSTSSAS